MLVFVDLILERFLAVWFFLQENFNSLLFFQDKVEFLVDLGGVLDDFQILMDCLANGSLRLDDNLIISLDIPKMVLVRPSNGVLWSWQVLRLLDD